MFDTNQFKLMFYNTTTDTRQEKGKLEQGNFCNFIVVANEGNCEFYFARAALKMCESFLVRKATLPRRMTFVLSKFGLSTFSHPRYDLAS